MTAGSIFASTESSQRGLFGLYSMVKACRSGHRRRQLVRPVVAPAIVTLPSGHHCYPSFDTALARRIRYAAIGG